MKKWFNASLVIIILLIGVFGCAMPSLPGKSAAKYKLEELDNRFVKANQAFGRKLYQQVALVENKAQNVFISPLSISLALDMVNNGAQGETQTAIRKVLGHEQMSLDEINQGNTVLLDLLKHNKSDITLSIANSLWMKKGKDFHEAFLQQSQKYYDAQLSALDFSDAKTITKINKWVDKQTNHKITKIINEPIDPQTVLFLMNAIYFNASWATPFNETATKTGDFHLMDGTIKQAPLMLQSGYYDFVATDQFQAIRLPYKGDSMNMLVI
jgi:serine protease inhibitor